MRESTYTRSVNRLLPRTVYALKLALRFTAGVPDSWYSGPGGDVWVEYKWYPRMPQVLRLTSGKDPKVSRLQQDWLTERHKEGRTVAVVVGSSQGSVILPGLDWLVPTPIRELLTKRQVAAWIAGVCGA